MKHSIVKRRLPRALKYVLMVDVLSYTECVRDLEELNLDTLSYGGLV